MREKFAKKLVTRGCNFGTKELYYPQWDFSERGGPDARAERLGGVNTTEWTHCPVLLEECLQGLRIRPDGVYVDGTLGRAGHARRIAERLTEGGRLIAIDQDQAALDAAPERFGELLGRVTLVRRNFRELPAVLEMLAAEASSEFHSISDESAPRTAGILPRLPLNTKKYTKVASSDQSTILSSFLSARSSAAAQMTVRIL